MRPILLALVLLMMAQLACANEFVPDSSGLIVLAYHNVRDDVGLQGDRDPDATSTDQPLVYCLRGDKISSQYDLWDQYDYRKHRFGQNAIYVRRLDPYKLEHGWISKWLKGEPVGFRDVPPLPPVPDDIASHFETVTNLGVREVKLADGRVIQRLEIFGCQNLK